MKAKYLLPCTACKGRVEVDSTDAGLTVRCACGQQLEVPTLRGLAELKQVAGEQSTAQRGSWGPVQATILFSLVIAVGALGFAGWRIWWTPGDPQINSEAVRQQIDMLSPQESFEYWDVLRQGLDMREDPLMVRYHRYRDEFIRWNYVYLTVGAIALLVAIGFSVVHFTSRKQPASR